jgi:hypothetical protein
VRSSRRSRWLIAMPCDEVRAGKVTGRDRSTNPLACTFIVTGAAVARWGLLCRANVHWCECGNTEGTATCLPLRDSHA